MAEKGVGFLEVDRNRVVDLRPDTSPVEEGAEAVALLDARDAEVADVPVAGRLLVPADRKTGQLLAVATGIFQAGVFEFLVGVTRLLSPAEYLILPLKTLSIGVVTGVVACVTAFRPITERPDVRELLPLGFMRAVVATLIVSGAITAMVL